MSAIFIVSTHHHHQFRETSYEVLSFFFFIVTTIIAPALALLTDITPFGVPGIRKYHGYRKCLKYTVILIWW